MSGISRQEGQLRELNDPETMARAVRLRRLMDASLANQTPQERDRIMQMHLAQARGPLRNAVLLCDMTAMLLRARQAAEPEERQDVRKPDR